jgi:cyanophycinase
MGGGTDTDEAFLWQIKNANGGDFVIIRASGDDAYNPWVYNMSIVSGARLNTVTTILFNDKSASEETEVLDLLRNAEAIFMAGGDQSVYVDYWVGTSVQSIIQSKLASVTIGGTSAGCMVLGNWIYTGEIESIDSETALANPYHRYVTIVDSFLKVPYLDSLLADTHFGKLLCIDEAVLAVVTVLCLRSHPQSNGPLGHVLIKDPKGRCQSRCYQCPRFGS